MCVFDLNFCCVADSWDVIRPKFMKLAVSLSPFHIDFPGLKSALSFKFVNAYLEANLPFL